MSVYILLKRAAGYEVVRAWDYQEEAYRTFMSNNNIVKIDFNDAGRVFSLKRFNPAGSQVDHRRFCTLVRENKTESVLSDNQEQLGQYMGWVSRIVSGLAGGKDYKRKSKRFKKTKKNKKRKSKRKSKRN